MRRTARLLLALSILSFPIFSPGSYAQDGMLGEHSSSSSTTSESEVKGFSFKYKEKFKNYTEQIEMGENKGWLTADQMATFRNRLHDLKIQEEVAGKNGYPKADIDALDKAVTKFNQDLSDASQIKPAAKPAAAPAEKPAATPAEKPAATPAKKPAASPAKKPAAKPKKK